MQTELRLSVGEHSFLAIYCVFTYEGEQPRKSNLTQLGSGSANTFETLFCLGQLSPADSYTEPFHEH